IVVEAQNLESLFASTALSAPDRPKLMKRLADQYAELAVAATPQGGSSKLAASARAMAIRYYTMLLAQHPGWCGNPGGSPAGCEDEALYHLGLEYERSGDAPGAWKTFGDLIKRYPRSAFAPHTYLAFGALEEATLDPSRLPLAEKAYQDAVKHAGPADV